MAVNLLDLLKNQFSGDIVSQIASAVGSSRGSAQTAIDGALPAILGRLVTSASNQKGADDLFRMLYDFGLDGTRLGSPADSLGSRSGTIDLMRVGGPLVATLFGPRQKGLTELLSSRSGIDSTASRSVLALTVPLVLDFVSKQAAAAGGFNPKVLAGLLASQGTFLKAVPAGMSTAPALHNFSPTLGGVSAPTGGQGTVGWLKWAVLLLAAGAILWSLWGGLRPQEPSSIDGTAAAAAGPAPTVGATADPAPAANSAPASTASVDAAAASSGAGGLVAAGSAPSVMSAYGVDLGPLTNRRLPNGAELNIPAKGVEAELIEFIEESGKPVSADLWFTLDRVEFGAGSAALRPSAQEQIENISQILKAFPGVAVKVGGYTDSRGADAANLKLSTDRALNTMNALVVGDVARDRLEAEGYGEQHPIASNETDEGRQRNRRIDLRVTRK